jgi:hypothetical protein
MIYNVTNELIMIMNKEEFEDVKMSEDSFIELAEAFMVPLGVTEIDKIMEYVNRLQKPLK